MEHAQPPPSPPEPAAVGIEAQGGGTTGGGTDLDGPAVRGGEEVDQARQADAAERQQVSAEGSVTDVRTNEGAEVMETTPAAEEIGE
eukprot:11674271-Ditylum_brightwellii.AAC.1